MSEDNQSDDKGAPPEPDREAMRDWSRERLEGSVLELVQKLNELDERERRIRVAYRLLRDHDTDQETRKRVAQIVHKAPADALADVYGRLSREISEMEADRATASDTQSPFELASSLAEERGHDVPPYPVSAPSPDGLASSLKEAVQGAVEAYGSAVEAGSVAGVSRCLTEISWAAAWTARAHGVPLDALAGEVFAAAVSEGTGWREASSSLTYDSLAEKHGFAFSSFEQYVDAISSVLAESDSPKSDALRALTSVLGSGEAKRAYESKVMPRKLLGSQKQS